MLNPEHSFTQTAEWCSWAMNHQENAVEDKPRCWTTGRGTFKQSCLWGLAESKLAVIDSSPNEQTLSLFPNLTSALLWLITCLLFQISAGLWLEKTNTHHWKKKYSSFSMLPLPEWLCCFANLHCGQRNFKRLQMCVCLVMLCSIGCDVLLT